MTDCVTVRQRQWIQDTVIEHGADYHGDLTKAVTHLIASKAKGAKYDRAKQWNIRIVSLKWFERSIERGLILQESLFDPLMDPEDQGRGAYDPQIKRQASRKRDRSEQQESFTAGSRRKMRRTASTRLNSQSQSMWEGLAGNEEESAPLEDSWSQSAELGTTRPHPTVETQVVKEPIKSIVTSASLSRADSGPKALFAGWKCLTHGHNAKVTAKLRQLLSENGAVLVDTVDELSDADSTWTALILPTSWNAKPDSMVPSVPQDTKLVTEWWVERCIIHKKVLDPDKDILSQSLHDLPGDCFKDRVVSTSGFGQDVRYVAAIVSAGGGVYEENLSRKVNILLYQNSNDLDKPAYCTERNIDVVTPDWFYTSLRQRQTPGTYAFFLPRYVCDAIQRIVAARRRSGEAQAKSDDAASKR